MTFLNTACHVIFLMPDVHKRCFFLKKTTRLYDKKMKDVSYKEWDQNETVRNQNGPKKSENYTDSNSI